MRRPEYPVHDGVAHVQVGRGHVYLRAQDARAVGELAGLHALEQVQVLVLRPFLYGLSVPGSVSVPLVSRIWSALRSSHVGLAGPYQAERELAQPVEIVGGVEQPVLPIDIPATSRPPVSPRSVLHLLPGGVRVVVPQIAQPAVLSAPVRSCRQKALAWRIWRYPFRLGETRVHAAVAPSGGAVGLHGWRMKSSDGAAAGGLLDSGMDLVRCGEHTARGRGPRQYTCGEQHGDSSTDRSSTCRP